MSKKQQPEKDPAVAIDILQAVSERLREESEETRASAYDRQDERDPVADAMSICFERLAEIIDEVLESYPTSRE